MDSTAKGVVLFCPDCILAAADGTRRGSLGDSVAWVCCLLSSVVLLVLAGIVWRTAGIDLRRDERVAGLVGVLLLNFCLAASGLALIGWARWLRGRLPARQALRWLPLVVSVALLAPVGLWLHPLIDELLRVFQAVAHVSPVYKHTILSVGLGEVADHAKPLGLLFAALYMSSVIVLAAVTGIEWRVLRRPPRSA